MDERFSEKLMRKLFPERFGWYDFALSAQYRSGEECRRLQESMLGEMLDYSVRTVPYYREVAALNGIRLSRGSAFENLGRFPALTRQLLRSRWEDLRSEGFSGRFFAKPTGGSTGEPVVCLQHDAFRHRNGATELLFFNWAGGRPGGKMIKLWGDERYLSSSAAGLKGLVKEHVMNIRALNSYRMSASDMEEYVNVINGYRPLIIEAYAESIHELAAFIRRKGRRVYSPRGIISTAGTLYPDMKTLLEEVFGCPVLNRYGCREAGDMACSCPGGDGLHENVFNHRLEVLDDNLRPCPPGVPGNVHVTTLHNRVMPLIRYRVGDVAVVHSGRRCSCGRGLPLIREVRGRRTEHFIDSGGGMVYAGYFRKLLYGRPWVRRYRIVQEDYNRVVYYVVKEEGARAPEKELEDIRLKAAGRLGRGVGVDFEFVENVDPGGNGKFLYTVCRVGKGRAS